MYNKDKYLELLDSPVIGQLFLTATTDVEERIKELSATMGNGRNHKSLTAAARARIARKKLVPIIKSSLLEGLYAAAGADTSKSSNRLAEEGLKSSLKTYLQAA